MSSNCLLEDEEGDALSSLLLTNYNALREEGQGFFFQESSNLQEKTDSTEGSFVALEWWCDLVEFSSDDADTIKYGVWLLLKKTSLNFKPTTRNSKPTTRNYCCVWLRLKKVLLLLVPKIPEAVSP